ncbi:MAG: hypothetical protein ACM3S5_15250 [Rhodospirillales bacterium]
MKRSIRTLVSLAVLLTPAFAGQGEEERGWRRVNEPGRIPSELTIPAGTLISARLDQMLSSELNDPGDAFSATLAQPVVVDGIVVANRGQIVAGRVVEVQKAGRVRGVSGLAVELTELTLADGRQVPLQTRLVSARGPGSGGMDVATIAGTAGLGALIGGAAEGGLGAGIGAAAGAAAGGIGVLLTRGRPTVLHPESVLTFRTEYPVTISTASAPLAFRYVTPEDYGRAYEPERSARVRYYDYYDYVPPPPPRVYVFAPPPYAYIYPPPFPYYWWRPRFWGPRFYGPSFGFGFFYGRKW